MNRQEVIDAVHRLDEAKRRAHESEEAVRAAENELDRMLAGEPLIVVTEEVKAAALTCTVRDMRLSLRAANALTNAGITTVGQLVERNPYDLLRLPNLGRIRLFEVTDWLTDRGLSLAIGADGWNGRRPR